MKSLYFDNYDKKYPDLIISIMEYFDLANIEAEKSKTVIDFCSKYKDENNQIIYQPQIIGRICRRMRDCGLLEYICTYGGNSWRDSYLTIIKNKNSFENYKHVLKNRLNCMVYGFEYIYEMYKDKVVPLVCDKGNGDYTIGTGFYYANGIVTAKHCIEDVCNIQIKGYSASELASKPIYISENDKVDIAFIETGRVEEPTMYFEDGEIMQEVLVIGYPKVPVFLPFQTVEKAMISSKASSRITPTTGTIAALGHEYLTSIDAILITARIRGGNSGGPVINENGALVGIACQALDVNPANGDYDDMGYGIAIPVKYLIDIITQKTKRLTVAENFFKDFVE